MTIEHDNTYKVLRQWLTRYKQLMLANSLRWTLRGYQENLLSPRHLKELMIRKRRKPCQQKHHEVECDVSRRRHATLGLGYRKNRLVLVTAED